MRKQQQQIEEMANCSPCYERYGKCPIKDKTNCTSWTRAVNQYEQGYRKIPKDALVLLIGKDNQPLDETTIEYFVNHNQEIRKETAKEILDYFDRYAGTGEKLIGNMISEQRKKYGIEVEE